MKRYYYTYFDRNYLIKGMALIESLQKHEKNDYVLFVICADEYTRLLLNRLNYQNVRCIALHEVERGNTALNAAKRNRNSVEYFWSLKAALALYLIEHHPQIDLLTYFDADLFFYSSPQPLFDEIGDHSILIQGHRFAPERKAMERYGRFNAGFIAVRNDSDGLAALEWWRDQCMQWCYARLEDGKYGDQLYLDRFPEKFKGVGTLEHIGAGVAPYNHIQYNFCGDAAGKVYVSGVPLVFYHFHALTFVEPEIIVPSKFVKNFLTSDILIYCFVPYADQLLESIQRVREIVPDFKFGLFNSKLLDTQHTFIARRSQFERITGSNPPQQYTRLNDTWDCYGSEQLKDANSLHPCAPLDSAEPGNHRDSNTRSSQYAVSYAKSEYDRGNKHTAISLLKRFSEEWPGNWLVDLALSEMLWSEGEHGAAVECLLKAYGSKPSEPQVAARLYNMLIQTDQINNVRQTRDYDGQPCINRLRDKGPLS